MGDVYYLLVKNTNTVAGKALLWKKTGATSLIVPSQLRQLQRAVGTPQAERKERLSLSAHFVSYPGYVMDGLAGLPPPRGTASANISRSVWLQCGTEFKNLVIFARSASNCTRRMSDDALVNTR
jgi:hypothetical protein